MRNLCGAAIFAVALSAFGGHLELPAPDLVVPGDGAPPVPEATA